MRAWSRDKPIYPWSAMQPGETVSYAAPDALTQRNIRRNVSQNGVRNGKSFRVQLDRSTTPPTMCVTRVR